MYPLNSFSDPSYKSGSSSESLSALRFLLAKLFFTSSLLAGFLVSSTAFGLDLLLVVLSVLLLSGYSSIIGASYLHGLAHFKQKSDLSTGL